ncbi:hypothetical protein IGB42_02434 [Andreprevotia sp. IGB-42]|uniref:hypothetical protein n=1 Tax=Andreprevotia sp. IGB-42 TaxID=2497473 RepID=UPI00135A082E|nr:hypothetical protein [Andreprevotia sp. IGB-42]KAF0813038.1 hypothetical protein IGB42_02434 [Andreprevotia sp. IGB-42]
MPINHFDLQRLAAIKIKEDIRKKGSPSRFGKDSSENASDEDKMAKSLVGRLIKQRVEPK